MNTVRTSGYKGGKVKLFASSLHTRRRKLTKKKNICSAGMIRYKTFSLVSFGDNGDGLELFVGKPNQGVGLLEFLVFV